MIKTAKELLVWMFPKAFPHRDKVTMSFEVVQGTRSVRDISFPAADDAADRLTPFKGEPSCSVSTAELVQMFNADPTTIHYKGKRSRPRARFG